MTAPRVPGQLSPVLRHSRNLPRYACGHSAIGCANVRIVLLSLDYPYPLAEVTAEAVLSRVSWAGDNWSSAVLEQVLDALTSLLPTDGYVHVADAVAIELLPAAAVITRAGPFRVHHIHDGDLSLVGPDHNVLSDPSDSADATRRRVAVPADGEAVLRDIGTRQLGTGQLPERSIVTLEPGDSLLVCSRTIHAWRDPSVYAMQLDADNLAALDSHGIVAAITQGAS